MAARAKTFEREALASEVGLLLDIAHSPQWSPRQNSPDPEHINPDDPTAVGTVRVEPNANRHSDRSAGRTLGRILH